MSLGGATAYHGWRTWVGLEEETTFGTRDTVSAYMEFVSESIKPNRETLKLESLNTTRDYMRQLQGNEVVEGSLEFQLSADNDAHIWIMKQAFGGTVGISTISAGVNFQHTLNLGDMESNKGTSTASDVKSLSISIQKGDTTTSQMHCSGIRINALTVSAEVGSPVNCTAEIIGRTATITSEAHTVAFPALTPLHFTGVSITTGQTTTSLTATSCIAFELSLNNNLINDTNARELGNRLLKILPPAQREVNLKLTMRFDTTTAYDMFMANSATSALILLDSGETIGSAGGSTYSMSFDLPKLYLENAPVPEISDKGIITQELEYFGVRENTTTAYVLKAQVNNSTVDYW